MPILLFLLCKFVAFFACKKNDKKFKVKGRAEVAMSTHQVFPLTGYIFDASYNTSRGLAKYRV